MGRLIRLTLILVMGAVAAWPVAPRFIGNSEIQLPIVEVHGHLTLLRLRGTPYEMGYQRGVAQRAAIRRLVEEEIYGRTILSGRQSHGILLIHARRLEQTLPLEIRRELRGIADGAGLSYDSLLLLNLVLNRLSASSPPPTLNLRALAFAAWPPATRQDDALGSTILGYRLEAPGQAERLRKHLLALVYQPTEGQTYATLTWSGQVGAWCGLNEAGLAICATPAKGEGVGEGELPPAILTRQLLAHAQDGEQALRQALRYDYVTAPQLLIADGQSQTAVTVAFASHRYEIIEPETGLLTLGQGRGQLDRNFGWLNRDKALAALANGEASGEGMPATCSKAKLFDILFVPGQGELWVGLGLWPASCRRYLRLRLAG